MRTTKSRSSNRLWIIGAAAAAALVLIIALLELTNTTHLLHKQTVPEVIPSHQNSGATNNDSDEPSNQGETGRQDQPTPQPSGGDTNHSLVTPTGNFVSNHFPGQNGSSTTEVSTCNTSPGASCYIKFTNLDTGDTTQLPSQTVDARGSTSWYWDTSKDAHLTSGQWEVTAVATLGGQTQTTDDSLKLTIQ